MFDTPTAWDYAALQQIDKWRNWHDRLFRLWLMFPQNSASNNHAWKVIWGCNVALKHLVCCALYFVQRRQHDLFLNICILHWAQKVLHFMGERWRTVFVLSNSIVIKKIHRSGCLTCICMAPGITGSMKKLALWNYRNFLCIMRLSWLSESVH